MTYASEILERPDTLIDEADTLIDENTASELMARFEKLRWMGMVEEAESLARLRRSVHVADIVLSTPCETD